MLSINGWSNAKYCINSNFERYVIAGVESKTYTGVCFNTALQLDGHINTKCQKKTSSICAMICRFINFSMQKHSKHHTKRKQINGKSACCRKKEEKYLFY